MRFYIVSITIGGDYLCYIWPIFLEDHGSHPEFSIMIYSGHVRDRVSCR